ncbi:heavy metal translocating P-type ATPase [Vagococcus humatus]|uniref:heavy metal translocating P-type ATPase n=1 Tax=Vagococcus humatus TaxID=1889241 RepID=UPI0026C6E6D2
MNRNKKIFAKILISASLLIINGFLPIPDRSYLQLAIYLVIYGIIGGDIVKKAVKNIIHGQVFDENFLMVVATIGAFFVGDYIEGVAVMLFFQIGELFQSYAVNQSRKSISQLMDIRPDYAHLKIGETFEQVDPDEVEIGDTILVKPGERVPVDGVVTKGSGLLDTSALTGESVPRRVTIEDAVLSGCINTSGVLELKVTEEFGDSTVNKILDLVENASSKKAASENFITKFARYYTPTVVFLALALALIPPILTGGNFSEWVHRALTFLVISCPCALVISVPLSFFGGIGGASKLGILIKGSNYLEALAQTDTIVFDKTGTLTKGTFEVQHIQPVNLSKEELLKLTAYMESFSTHPIGASLKQAYGKDIDKNQVTDLEELAGYGLKGKVFGKSMLVGNEKLMKQEQIDYLVPEEIGTLVHVAINQSYAGYIVIADQLKVDAKQAIYDLQHQHRINTVMLTGDTKETGEAVASSLGIPKVYTQLLPGDKVTQLETLLKEEKAGHKLAFVGDGINDAPVLARADIGIAMGGLGSDAAIEAADIVIMTDEPSRISTAIHLSRKTLKIVKENIVFAIVIKVLFLILGALGIASMGGAVFADVGVTVIAVLNAMRCLNVKPFEKEISQSKARQTMSPASSTN